MPPQNSAASGLNKPFYLPGRSWPRRRFATTVLAGHFDKRLGVVSHAQAPPLEERTQNISDSVAQLDTNRTLGIPSKTANEPSTSELKPASGREAVARGTTATSNTLVVDSASRKPSKRSISTASIPKAKTKSSDSRPTTQSSVAAALNAQKKSKSNPPKALSPLSQILSIPNTRVSTSTTRNGKRPVAPDSEGGDARPAKKPRASAPPQASMSSYPSSTPDINEKLANHFSSPPPYPNLSINVPELTRAGTTIDTSSPSPHALLGLSGEFMSLSPAPSSTTASHSGMVSSKDGDMITRTASEGPTITLTTQSKRTKVKKGWKGWIEVDSDAVPESPLLLKIDEPIVLEKTRQTRSGRQFAAIDGDGMASHDQEAGEGDWEGD